MVYLTETVLEEWDEYPGWVKSMVAHEVGHAVEFVCSEHVDPGLSDERELFATAWAISKGYTDTRSNGVETYAEPTDEYVAQVAGCEAS